MDKNVQSETAKLLDVFRDDILTLVDSTLPANSNDNISYQPPPYCPSANKEADDLVNLQLFVYEKGVKTHSQCEKLCIHC